LSGKNSFVSEKKEEGRKHIFRNPLSCHINASTLAAVCYRRFTNLFQFHVVDTQLNGFRQFIYRLIYPRISIICLLFVDGIRLPIEPACTPACRRSYRRAGWSRGNGCGTVQLN